MKKIISVVLLLALCIGCFAGCAPKEDAALNAAAEYLYAMYKDADTVTSADYSVVSQVRIDDVTYPITWTADAAENVAITAGENNMTVVKITAGAEDVNYKLTATLKNEDGQEVSVSFDHTIPAAAQVGGNIVLAFPKENKYVTGIMHLYKTKYELVLSENKADAVALEVVDNGDDTVSFKAGDKYLFCDANTVEFAAEQSDNTKFVLEAADTDGGYFIKCAVANYGGKAQYLEVYSGYLTCYGMGSDSSIYIFKLEDAAGANGSVAYEDAQPAPETSTPPTTNPPATNPPATNPPATNPPATNPPATQAPATNPPATQAPATNVGASVTFDFSSLDKKGVEIKADEALSVFNSVASGGGLTAITDIVKIYNGNGQGGAHPNSSGFIRCGKSDTEGELVMTFSKKVAKVEVVCHDWYKKSDEYPTNTISVAINGSTPQLAPYNTEGTGESLTFNLDGTSNTVDFDFSNSQSGKTGRVFIFKIIVTFA